MINLKDKKIIILAVIIALLVVALIIFIISRQNNQAIITGTVNGDGQTRLMTNQEKEMVGLDKNQKAEVVNDQEGFFIYNVVE